MIDNIPQNYVTLKEHFDTRIIALEKATTLAAERLDVRMAGMNEFREALKDQSTTFTTKAEFSVILSRIEEDIRSLRETRAEMVGKASMTSVWVAYAISVIGIIIGIIGLF